MGEESAGIDAVRIAHARIGAGQSDIALVGGSYNGERPDLLMLYEFAKLALKDKYAPVWQRGSGNGGFALASLGAFLVIEAREHAEKRGVKALGRLTSVVSDRASRKPGYDNSDLGAALGQPKKQGRRKLTQPFYRARRAPTQRRQKNASSSKRIAILPFAPRAHISAMGWSRNSP